MHAPGPSGALEGTMLKPASPHAPLVLIIPGSGPTDRDGNGPAGLAAATYRLLAAGLAERGIGTVRIDKRGIGGSSAAVADPNAVTMQDYAADARTWITALQRRTGASCVWLLGHSEGGLVALLAAQRPDGICGLVLAATPGRPLGDVLREQLRSNPANAPVLGQALSILAQLEAGKRVDESAIGPALLPLFRPAVQGFLTSEFALDPAALIRSCRLPVLIVQADHDLQVSVADAKALAHAQPAAKLAILHDTNHVLKTVASTDRAANIATYGDPTLPLAPGVVATIAGFVLPSR